MRTYRTGDRVRLGVVGTGAITHKFLIAAAGCGAFTVTAVCSRDEARGRAFAAEYGAERVFTTPEAMAAGGGLDAVYIASPNALHFRQARCFLEQGVPVLLEKPFTSNAREAEELFRLADEKGVLLLEAIRSAAMPCLRAIRESLPRLGRIRGVYASKCQYSSRYDRFRRGIIENAFKRELSNGALMDIGRYCVCPVAELFGMPEEIRASAHFLSTGVDGAGSAILTYDGMDAILQYSKISDSFAPFEIQGEEGVLTAEDVYEFRSPRIRYRDESIEEIGPFQEELPMRYEAGEFLRCLQEGLLESPVLSRRQTLVSMRIMDRIREQIGLVYPAD